MQAKVYENGHFLYVFVRTNIVHNLALAVKQPVNSAALLSFQAVNGVGPRCFYSLGAYSKQRNSNSNNTCNGEYPPRYINAVSKVLQPGVHRPPSNGYGY